MESYLGHSYTNNQNFLSVDGHNVLYLEERTKF